MGVGTGPPLPRRTITLLAPALASMLALVLVLVLVVGPRDHLVVYLWKS